MNLLWQKWCKVYLKSIVSKMYVLYHILQAHAQDTIQTKFKEWIQYEMKVGWHIRTIPQHKSNKHSKEITQLSTNNST